MEGKTNHTIYSSKLDTTLKMASHQKIAKTTEDWSNPPSEILSALEKCLENRIDILRCRSVCKNWRASINPNPNPNPSLLSPILPLKFPNSTLPFNDRPNETLILFARTVLLVKPLSSSDDTCNWILTVEELIQGKLRILYPLSNDHIPSLPSNFPKHLNLLDYNVSEIATSYGFKYESDGKDVVGVHKVILCSDFTAMVLYGDGILIGARLKSGKWGFVRDSLVNSLADVISFKGMVCSVDSKGCLHTIDHNTMKVIKFVAVNPPMLKFRKRLVVHEAKLLLVSYSANSSMRDVDLTCSILDEQQKKWSATRFIGWLHFLSPDWCFFVRPHDLNISDHLPKRAPERTRYSYSRPQSSSWDVARKEYLVCALSCFKWYAASDDLALVYNGQYFEGGSINQFTGFFNSGDPPEERDRVKYLRNIISGALWPPPIWFLPDTYTSSGEEDELELGDQNISIDSKGKLLVSLTVAPDLGTAKNSTQVQDKTEVDMQMALDDSYALRIQHVNPCAATSLFERVKIKSNLVPTLQNIWAKHGNVIEESKIRNGDLIAKALESLATIVLILQSSSGRSLDDIQAEYLSSTLSDLQQMNFTVDWLVPYIGRLATERCDVLLFMLCLVGKMMPF